MRKALFIIFISLVLIFLYGHYIEINNFKIHNYTIYNENIPDSFKELKIIHFSDVLYEQNYSENLLDKLVAKINEYKPDVIIFTGDLLKGDKQYNEEDYNLLADIFSKMDAKLFKFAVVGDNDESHLEEYKDILYKSDFILLDDENKLFFYKDNTPINIIGLRHEDKLDELLQTDTEYQYSLLITHKPDIIDKLNSYDIPTILVGHSLGGIINIPYYGGLFKKNGAQTYINDYYNVYNKELFISNGLGYEKFNFRLFNSPSINIYHFDN